MSNSREVNTKPIRRAERAIRSQQRRDRQMLNSAVVGRPLELPKESELRQELPAWACKNANYLARGYIAAVYLLRRELIQYRGRTFFNTTQVNNAISGLGVHTATTVTVAREHLELVESRPQSLPNGRSQYWLFAHAGRATTVTPDKPMGVDLRAEELALANSLFEQENEVTGQPYLWLGAVAAGSLDAARDLLDPLEDIIPATLIAGPVALVHRKTR